MKVRADISKRTAVACGGALGAACYGGLQAILPEAEGVLSTLPVLGAVAVAASFPSLFSHRTVTPPHEFAALDLLPDEVWVMEAKTERLRYVNAAAALRSGVQVGVSDTFGLLDMLPIAQHCALGRALNNPEDPNVPVLDIGEHRFRPSVSRIQGGHYLMIVLRDVTQEITDQQVKDDFISTVSHELRSPLTSIKGSMGLLLSNAAGELPKPARGLLEIAHRNAERLVLIINDILDLQKITDGSMAFDVQPVDAAALIHEALAASALFLQRFDLNIEVIGAETPVFLQSDPNRIIQVLGNLLSNAAKFSKPHGTITIRLEQNGTEVTISVQDEGAGIPAAEQSKIFARFADMTNSDRQKNGGSGLGLSICKAIVEPLGGKISFVSTEGVGSTFSITFPRDEALDVTQASDAADRYTG